MTPKKATKFDRNRTGKTAWGPKLAFFCERRNYVSPIKRTMMRGSSLSSIAVSTSAAGAIRTRCLHVCSRYIFTTKRSHWPAGIRRFAVRHGARVTRHARRKTPASYGPRGQVTTGTPSTPISPRPRLLAYARQRRRD